MIIEVVTDELGNEIIEGMEVTIPADLAEEHGAFEDDSYDEEAYKGEVQ